MNIETVLQQDKTPSFDMALKALCPTAKYHFMNDVLVWEDTEIQQPTDAKIQAKIVEILAQIEA